MVMVPETEPLDVRQVDEEIIFRASIVRTSAFALSRDPQRLSALLMAHLDGKEWPEAVRFAHEVASLKLRVEGHVERMIDRESLYASLESIGQRVVSR